MDKSLNYFLEEIRRNPIKIMSDEYKYISVMFPEEYIKGMRLYIDFLIKELDAIRILPSKKKKIFNKIRSRL